MSPPKAGTILTAVLSTLTGNAVKEACVIPAEGGDNTHNCSFNLNRKCCKLQNVSIVIDFHCQTVTINYSNYVKEWEEVCVIPAFGGDNISQQPSQF